jgi:hypothetical protein
MGLVQVATETVTSATASVTLTGIDSDDVYMVSAVGIKSGTDNSYCKARVTKSTTPDTTANYDLAYEILRTDTSFSTNNQTNGTEAYITHNLGTSTSEFGNFILYLYNFNSSSEYSFATVETTDLRYDVKLMSRTGGFVHTVASASDGIQFLMNSGNLEGGTFTLYRVV